MAAVGGGVENDVFRPGGQPAFQHSLQGAEVIVVSGKRQVVDENDELHGQPRQIACQIGQLAQVLLGHLDHAQAHRGVFVEQGLDGGGFAGAPIAVQQHVVGLESVEESQGIVHCDLPLVFVAFQLRQADGIRVLHWQQSAVPPEKSDMADEPAAAVGFVIGGKRLGRAAPGPLHGGGGRRRAPARQGNDCRFFPNGREFLRRHLGGAVQDAQIPQGRRFQQRSRCLTRGKRGGKGVIVPQHLLGHGGGKAVQPPGLRQRGAQGAPALAKLSGIFSDRRFHQLQQRGGYRLDEHFSID